MPRYDYRCDANGRTLELSHGMNERVLTWGDALPAPDDWGPTAVLGWARVVWAPWAPSVWRRWVGGVRARAHMLRGRGHLPRSLP